MKYLTNTFSPAMLGKGAAAEIAEIDLGDIPKENELVSAISHEITAEIFSALLGEKVDFCRAKLILKKGDCVYCIVPNFRASEAREFARAEVEKAGFRCFLAEMR